MWGGGGTVGYVSPWPICDTCFSHEQFFTNRNMCVIGRTDIVTVRTFTILI